VISADRLEAPKLLDATVDISAPAAANRTRLLSKCRLGARLAGLVGVWVGLVVLFGGWAWDIARLRTIVPGYSAMVPNTALGLLLCGVALSLDRSTRTSGARRLLVGVCAGAAGLIGALTLMQYALGRDLGINGLLFPKTMMRLAPGRMAVMSAAAFLLLSGALFLSRHRSGFAVGQYFVIVSGVLCLFNVIGYVYGIRSFYGLAFRAGSTAMAIHASLVFVILCAGVLLSRPDWGLMATITSSAPGGLLARRLLPAAFLIPLATGLLQLQGQLKGFYDTAFGLTLFTVVNVVVFAFLIWRSAQILNRLDVERALAERNMWQLADSMPQMVWAATPGGDIDYYNQRWYDYTGMTFAQSKDWGWKPVLHPDDLQNTIDRWTEAFTTCGPYEVEYRFRRAADNVYRWHLGRARPIRDAGGIVVRWFGTCTDIDDYKQAEAEIKGLNEGLEERVRERTGELDRANRRLATVNEELNGSARRLEQSNRELQDFASVASHDLQEPLRKVQAFGDRLKTGSRDALDDQGRDYLDRMLSAAKRMQSLIQDLLRFARITSQAHPFLPVDLARVTQEVLSDLEVRIAETNAQVEVSDLPVIDADAMQMRQLLQNLIGNALKFHPEERAPLIRVYAENRNSPPGADDILKLVVEDNGIGFDEKYLDRIFTVFQRLHGRAEYEGTGVGLAICRKIAQRHGGDITARSTPGQGASFVVALPFRQPDENNPRILNAESEMNRGVLSAAGSANSIMTPTNGETP
jgi:PAS domain S-box-containing protein